MEILKLRIQAAINTSDSDTQKHYYYDVDVVTRLESFRALKLSRYESFRPLKFSDFESYMALKVSNLGIYVMTLLKCTSSCSDFVLLKLRIFITRFLGPLNSPIWRRHMYDYSQPPDKLILPQPRHYYSPHKTHFIP